MAPFRIKNFVLASKFLENLWTSGVGDTFDSSIPMTELAATQKRRYVSTGFHTPEDGNFVRTETRSTSPRTQAVSPTNDCRFRRSHNNVRSYELQRRLPQQDPSNSPVIFVRPKPQRLVESACSLPERNNSYRLVTARVLWVGAVRLQPFNGTWFGTCVILSCGPSFSGARMSIINVPIW